MVTALSPSSALSRYGEYVLIDLVAELAQFFQAHLPGPCRLPLFTHGQQTAVRSLLQRQEARRTRTRQVGGMKPRNAAAHHRKRLDRRNHVGESPQRVAVSAALNKCSLSSCCPCCAEGLHQGQQAHQCTEDAAALPLHPVRHVRFLRHDLTAGAARPRRSMNWNCALVQHQAPEQRDRRIIAMLAAEQNSIAKLPIGHVVQPSCRPPRPNPQHWRQYSRSIG